MKSVIDIYIQGTEYMERIIKTIYNIGDLLLNDFADQVEESADKVVKDISSIFSI